MRILKNKVAKAQKTTEVKIPSESPELNQKLISSFSYPNSITQTNNQPKKRSRVPGIPVSSERDRATKNIVKNYGKAIASFASSTMAKPYLIPILEEHRVKVDDFLEFASKAKESIESINTFRDVLLITDNDRPQTVKLRKVFAAISEVFIKFFSVNWIYSGRLTHKNSHLQFRFKLLRRIRSPESFTFLRQRGEKWR